MPRLPPGFSDSAAAAQSAPMEATAAGSARLMNATALRLLPAQALWQRVYQQRRFLLIAVIYVAMYVAADALSYVSPVLRLDISPWNPQAALTLSFLLAYGLRGLPVAAIAAFAAEALVHDLPAPWWMLLCACVWIACGYTALAAVLRRAGLPHSLDSSAMAARLAVGVMLASLGVAVGYVGLLTASGALPSSLAIGAVARYWVGDANGILTLVPLIMDARRWRRALMILRRRVPIAALQLGSVVLAMWIIFGSSHADQVRFFYLLFVPVIWIALTWGVAGAALSTLAIQIGVVIAVQYDPTAPRLVDLQFLLLTLSLTALLLGAVVTERADALRRMATSEAEQRALLSTAPDAVLTVNSLGHLRSANSEARHLFGLPRIPDAEVPLGAVLPGIELKPPQGRAALEGRRANGSAFPAELAWVRLEAPATAEYLVIVRDVTERRRAEMQLRERERALAQAMRFAVAGELASALAHELNQPITAVVSYLQASQILATPLTADVRLGSTLAKAAQEAHRASEVLRRLRDFYRGGTTNGEYVRLEAVCASIVAAFKERLQRCGIALEMRLAEKLPGVHSDITRLEIVLHNLLGNAIDAMLHRPLERRQIELVVQRSEKTVELSVEDSGPGVDKQTASKLFEPFVTTKAEGMGLGLAISRSLLRAQGGDLLFESGSRWGGARFVVRLPTLPELEAPV
jgi:signal transduction histidine kinase